MIHFSLKFTILSFLYPQAIYHLFTIIYYGTCLHKSHVVSHTLEGNSEVKLYNPKTTLNACVQRICPNSHLPKQKKLTNIP